ncbi:MAG TPA: PepSY domain-containing protein [Anaerolineae bacterium]|nr:PepSY domain-containing protein [Anaerolineae bacterium]HOR01565.1 PepSY domain-containing protein [Anaerolineae bacterium]
MRQTTWRRLFALALTLALPAATAALLAACGGGPTAFPADQGTAIAVATSSPDATATPTATPTPVFCSDEEAMAIIRAFVGRPQMVPKLEPELMDKRFPWERHYFEEGSGASFTVDIERRAVLSAMLPRGYAGPGGTLDCDQAQQVATEFAAARVPGFERLTLVGSGLMDEDVGPRCEFLWQELLGTQEAYGMQAARVSIDGATGCIDLFAQRLPVPITLDVEPKVTREQALAIAEQRFGQNVRTRWAQLSVGWRHDDRAQGQVLRWEVVLQSDPLNPELPDMPLRGSYTIDAQTGEVLEELR